MKDVVVSGQAANDPAGSSPAAVGSTRRDSSPTAAARPAEAPHHQIGPQDCGDHPKEVIVVVGRAL